MASRRYKVGKNPKYDQAFDRYKGESPIINPRGSGIGVHSLNLSDKQSLRSILLEWRGVSEHPDIAPGFYVNGDSGWTEISHLKAAQEKITEIETQFMHHRQKTINEGRSAPKELPIDMQDAMHKAEARLDITKSEIETLERLIKNFVDQAAKISADKVLKRGPQGSGKLRGEFLSVVDGQTVTPDENGILRIDEPRSRYHGMRTADYFDLIVKPWKRQNLNLLNEHTKKSRASRLADPDAEILNAPKAPWPPNPDVKKKEA